MHRFQRIQSTVYSIFGPFFRSLPPLSHPASWSQAPRLRLGLHDTVGSSDPASAQIGPSHCCIYTTKAAHQHQHRRSHSLSQLDGFG